MVGYIHYENFKLVVIDFPKLYWIEMLKITYLVIYGCAWIDGSPKLNHKYAHLNCVLTVVLEYLMHL